MTDINVRDFGALGDGAANDAPAFQAAIDAAALAGNFSVRVPAGDYRIGATLLMRSGVRLLGDGYTRFPPAPVSGARLTRSANLPLLRLEGTSILSGGPLINRCEIRDLTLDGANLDADLLVLRACHEFHMSGCFLRAVSGRWILARELWDSTIVDTRFEYGGRGDGTAPGIELASGSGYELTNQVHFRGCIFETYTGIAVGSSGNGTNELSFTTCKFESTISMFPAMRFSQARVITLRDLTVYSRGANPAGTIEAQLVFDQCADIRATLFCEHAGVAGTDAASLGQFVRFSASSNVDLDIQVYDGEDQITAPQLVTFSGSGASQVVTGSIAGTNPTQKNISNAAALQGNVVRLDPFGEPSLQLRNRALAQPDSYFLGRIQADGSATKFRFVVNNGTADTDILTLSGTRDVVVERSLQVRQATYLGRTSSQPTGINGALYFDTATGINALRIYNNGAWQRIGYATSPPSAGNWQRGDIIYNSQPSAGGYVGWSCTASGIPGTWCGFGLILL